MQGIIPVLLLEHIHRVHFTSCGLGNLRNTTWDNAFHSLSSIERMVALTRQGCKENRTVFLGYDDADFFHGMMGNLHLRDSDRMHNLPVCGHYKDFSNVMLDFTCMFTFNCTVSKPRAHFVENISCTRNICPKTSHPIQLLLAPNDVLFQASFFILDILNENSVSSTCMTCPVDFHGAKQTHLDTSQTEYGDRRAYLHKFTAAAAAAAVAGAALMIAQGASGTSIKNLLIQDLLTVPFIRLVIGSVCVY